MPDTLLAAMRQKLKIVLSWLVAALGCFAGLFALARFGMSWLPLGEPDPGWFLYWLTFAGFGLFGPGFLAGSIVAPRDPKRAGIIFLVFLPMAAFCLAYPESGFLVWHADGSGWFETPLPLTAIGLTVLFFIPFVLPLFTLHHKKRAAIVFAVAVLGAVPMFIHSRWTTVLVPHLLGYSAPLLLFGMFWLGTHKLGWPSLLSPRARGPARRIASIVVTCIVVSSLDVAMTLGLAALTSSLFSGDCSGKPPITHPESPKHAVFTARVIFVGRSIEALTRGTELRSLGVQNRPVGDWAIGVVQERFWGVPSRWPHLVLMTNYIYWKGETYFIDGLRESGLITRILPIVGARVGCSRSRPVQDAIVDLCVLREAPPAAGTRLIGYVRRPGVFTGVFEPPTVPSFAAGATVDVTATAGTKTVTTDKTGIYQLDGLAPGEYTLQLTVPDNQVVGL